MLIRHILGNGPTLLQVVHPREGPGERAREVFYGKPKG
jgi:hypothetical protein